MIKSIYFITDSLDKYKGLLSDSEITLCTTYADTGYAINQRTYKIATTSIANMSFDLLDHGYDIFLCRNGYSIQLYPGMRMVGLAKVIRRSHNILRLFLAGFFDKEFDDDIEFHET